MSSARSVALSGLIALMLATALIAISALSGSPVLLGTSSATSSTSSSQGTAHTTSSTGVVQTTLSSGATQTVSQGGVTQTTTSTSSGGVTQSTTSTSSGGMGEGVLSILVTDPPRVPQGVTYVYVTYTGLSVHGEGGWTITKASGEIELLGTVNLAQTLSSVELPPGNYDSLRLNISSATVTFNDRNYSATVEGGKLTVRIEGGQVVSSSQAAAALIDIQPTVINVGSLSGPQFIVTTVATAFSFPGNEVTPQMENEGNRVSLLGMSWWSLDQEDSSVQLQITSASLSANSIRLSVENTGAVDAHLRLVIVSSVSPIATGQTTASVPSDMTGSAVFVILPNGTLVQFAPRLHMVSPYVRTENQSSIVDFLLTSGYELTAGGTATFSYSGAITLGFGMLTQAQPVSQGSSYWITVIGDDAITSVEVTAS